MRKGRERKLVIKRTRIITTPLEFHVDYLEGNHEILVYQMEKAGKTLVNNITELWRHGLVGEKTGVKHRIELEDLQVLLALKSTNPSIGLEGVIRFELNPSILNYLRNKRSVVQSESSKNILISADRLKKRVDVSYDPSSGLHIKTGYQIPGAEELIPKKQLKQTSDPEYICINDSFYPAPEAHNERISEYLEKGEIIIDNDQIDDFFQGELEFLNYNFEVVNNNATSQMENVRRLKSILRGML